MLSRFRRFITLICFALLQTAIQADDSPSEVMKESLKSCRIEKGISRIEALLKQSADAQDAELALGVLGYFHAMEGLVQDYYRYGASFQGNLELVPGFGSLELRTPANPTPVEIAYEDARGIFIKFQKRLEFSRSHLQKVPATDLKFVLDINEVFVDIDSDGTPAHTERIRELFRVPRRVGDSSAKIEFAFDRADVFWLLGYTHLLSGLTDLILAYDWRESFDRCAHLIFPKVKSRFSSFLRRDASNRWDMYNIIDLIAAIHTTNFEVIEPERMKSSLVHFEKVISTSRETWKLVLAESDDDREWLPGPTQHSLVMGGIVGGTLHQNWAHLLDLAELVFKGDRLIPFWREDLEEYQNSDGTKLYRPSRRGLNVRKFLLESRRFDLVLFAQGTDAEPYLEKGVLIDMSEWVRIQGLFQGQLPFFVFWVN